MKKLKTILIPCLAFLGLTQCLLGQGALQTPKGFELGPDGIITSYIYPDERGNIDLDDVIDYRNLSVSFDDDFIYYSMEIRTKSYLPPNDWVCTLYTRFMGYSDLNSDHSHHTGF